ncbi:LuxR C-terminal-related transcriptional regulator [Cetobacterium somerae]|uniref:helix-turn-helix transcriptional regulator n=1 Tax=Cetobacterium somerae TaxID=188913 RepID=UPI002E7B42C0|nr:LuxR C-terminal-related transcriptional regulator [Cetobacterium somerae]WVJ02042.1 LuxR C-terminal-related transcriptional regulator [Cetobacterium somerae]
MKIYYNSDSVNSCTENDSIFAHRDVSEMHEERVRIKNAVIETVIDLEVESLTKREKQYWLLHRQGIKNKDISRIMGVELDTCKTLKYRANKKIIAFSKKLTKKL